ncbi:MAG: S-adenosyl-l-methionine hydroxide adenosyltransferase family protein, partial [Nitrospiria bacterium]
MRYSKSPLNSNDQIITLTTDFGIRDYFVGSLKGVLLQRVPNARLIDITHETPRHDIISAAFVVNEIYRTFPQGAIHLVVVDPGVGTERKKLIVSKEGHLFVAPDNGVLTYLFKEEGSRVYEVVDTRHLTFSNSPTFAGRDHFAPIVASLAVGILPEALGREISDYQCIKGLYPERKGSDLVGKIVYFDHFGNAITNL